MRKPEHLAALIGLLAASSTVMAQSPVQDLRPWWVHVGPARLEFQTKADVRIAGATVPGGGADASGSTTMGAEFGYHLTPAWSARLTFGVPPTAHLTGTGSLAGAGELGHITYAPAIASLTWSVPGLGASKPYVGVGINYTAMTKTREGAITSLRAKSAFGSVLQAGFDLPLGPRWGVFLDLKKIYLKTTVTGTVGGAGAEASVRLDPLLVHAGVSYRFD
jgi:outer membrane protein